MTFIPGVTIAIPVHPLRLHSTLDRALHSVWEQTLRPQAVAIAVDSTRAGAAATRNEALAMVRTEWTAFLDSDDQLMPEHLDRLVACQRETGADLVFPHFTVVNGFDPFAAYEGQPFDPVELDTFNRIPVTVLVRTGLLRDAGGFQPLGPPENPCDDFGAWRALVKTGGVIHHLNCRTWRWHWASGPAGNTSGSGSNW